AVPPSPWSNSKTSVFTPSFRVNVSPSAMLPGATVVMLPIAADPACACPQLALHVPQLELFPSSQASPLPLFRTPSPQNDPVNGCVPEQSALHATQVGVPYGHDVIPVVLSSHVSMPPSGSGSGLWSPQNGPVSVRNWQFIPQAWQVCVPYG